MIKTGKRNIAEIKFVAKKLQNILNKSDNTDEHINSNHTAEVDHDCLINKNFWGYVKKYFKKSNSLLPSFNMAQCTSYFTKTFSAINPSKTFSILSWIAKFASPQMPFNLDPPNLS